MNEFSKQKVLTLYPESKKILLDEVLDSIRPGDVLMFYHRTSWRSQWIKRITGCKMPHTCVYQGNQRVVGMLKGRVCTHRIGRFFKNEYDLLIVRANPRVLDFVKNDIGKREAFIDLLSLWLHITISRIIRHDARNFMPYKMLGVTCSGIVSSALHLSYQLASMHCPHKDTPKDVETIIQDLKLEVLGNFSLVPQDIHS